MPLSSPDRREERAAILLRLFWEWLNARTNSWTVVREMHRANGVSLCATSDGHELLQVFEREQCNRLAAFSDLKTVAGT